MSIEQRRLVNRSSSLFLCEVESILLVMYLARKADSCNITKPSEKLHIVVPTRQSAIPTVSEVKISSEAVVTCEDKETQKAFVFFLYKTAFLHFYNKSIISK